MPHLPSQPDLGTTPYFPILLDLRGRIVVLVGGGEAAASKARLLARAGAAILLVADRLSSAMVELLESGAIVRREFTFRPCLLDGAVLAIDGAGRPELTDTVRAAAFSRNVLVHVVDVPEHCDVMVPTLWDEPPSGDAADGLIGIPEAGLRQFQYRQDEAAGSVALVGAGPGDPGLLTLNAARAIGEADVILHDALVPDSILAMARRETRLISVGKRAGCRSVPQEFTNRLMAAYAKRGLRVVRLKGGDPFIFGRAGEEAAFLRERGIAVTVVPGITAAIGAAAQLGLPLTHRGVARSLRIITAHCRTSTETDAIDWTSLADPSTTLALYMGRDRLGEIAKSLIAAGLPPTTPAALIANACRPDSEARFAPIVDLPNAPALTDPGAPSLILVGDAVAHAPGWAAMLGWQAERAAG
jgi:uroporphyrin-III C-methyltransferase / precorrin-2 dehydrogenase / sirohydrochlorin ferrochelatase